MHKLSWTGFQGITSDGEFDGDSDLCLQAEWGESQRNNDTCQHSVSPMTLPPALDLLPDNSIFPHKSLALF